jgi:hypothetical protein
VSSARNRPTSDVKGTAVLPQPRRRWAFFPGSVLSDFENPPALLYREMARCIVDLGDEARFYEERGNPWLRNMLTQRGARGFLDFQHHHPAVDYVTFDPRTGADLADWLTRVLATVDIVLVDAVAPRDIARWVAELTRPHLQTFVVDPGERHPSIVATLQNVSQFTGVCVRDAGQSPLVIGKEPHQVMIEFGPFATEPGQNGDATRNLTRTASTLVDRIANVVDETRIDQQAGQNGTT